VFRHAAKGALVEWGIEGEVDEITQELWEWYLQRPTTQEKMANLSDPERIVTAKRAAHQMISRDVLEGNIASQKVIYSTESVREALHGMSTNKYLLEILPEAKRVLGARNEAQAEAIRRRYDDGVVPAPDSAEHSMLRRAVKSLADEVNVMYLTSDDDGAGRREAAAPNVRKRGGGYSDPTAGIALALMNNPGEREAFYEEWDSEDWYGEVDELEPPTFPVNIMDAAFNGMPGSEFYRAQVFPELYPHQPRMLVEHWPAQDVAEYCVGLG
jgi:hypothetical protein